MTSGPLQESPSFISLQNNPIEGILIGLAFGPLEENLIFLKTAALHQLVFEIPSHSGYSAIDTEVTSRIDSWNLSRQGALPSLVFEDEDQQDYGFHCSRDALVCHWRKADPGGGELLNSLVHPGGSIEPRRGGSAEALPARSPGSLVHG